MTTLIFFAFVFFWSEDEASGTDSSRRRNIVCYSLDARVPDVTHVGVSSNIPINM
jgi:hypothetical protein